MNIYLILILLLNIQNINTIDNELITDLEPELEILYENKDNINIEETINHYLLLNDLIISNINSLHDLILYCIKYNDIQKCNNLDLYIIKLNKLHNNNIIINVYIDMFQKLIIR